MVVYRPHTLLWGVENMSVAVVLLRTWPGDTTVIPVIGIEGPVKQIRWLVIPSSGRPDELIVFPRAARLYTCGEAGFAGVLNLTKDQPYHRVHVPHIIFALSVPPK
jgi:hypothetical protein